MSCCRVYELLYSWMWLELSNVVFDLGALVAEYHEKLIQNLTFFKDGTWCLVGSLYAQTITTEEQVSPTFSSETIGPKPSTSFPERAEELIWETVIANLFQSDYLLLRHSQVFKSSCLPLAYFYPLFSSFFVRLFHACAIKAIFRYMCHFKFGKASFWSFCCDNTHITDLPSTLCLCSVKWPIVNHGGGRNCFCQHGSSTARWISNNVSVCQPYFNKYYFSTCRCGNRTTFQLQKSRQNYSMKKWSSYTCSNSALVVIKKIL